MKVTKPSVAKRTGAAFIALAMAGSIAIPAMTGLNQDAYADGIVIDNGAGAKSNTITGTITINATTDNANVNYKAYKLFNGYVQSGNKISNVTFVDQAAHDAVWKAIGSDATDPVTDWSTATYDTKAESAQVAAEYIAAHIADVNSTPSVDSTLIVDHDSFAETLSRACDDLTAVGTLTPGTKATLEEGYYLFTTDQGTIGTQEAGTSPIFAVVGAGDVVVHEKVTVPTLAKEVKEDSQNSYGKAADANRGMDVDYLLRGTVADNIASYDTYAYTFTDKADAGLAINLNSVKVYLHHLDESKKDHSSDVTPYFETKTLSDGTLTVGTSDIRKAGIGAVRGDYITVEYTAQLNGSTVQGGTGNQNTATLTYSSDPQKADATATTNGDAVKTYAYTLSVHKQDLQNATRSLAGAKMTLQVKKGDDPASDGKYVQADGSLGDTAFEFTTDKDGNWTVPNLDAGIYVLTETAAPAGTNGSRYDLLGPTDIMIYSNIADLSSNSAVDQKLFLNATVTPPVQTHLNGSTAVLADSVSADGNVNGKGIDIDTGTINVVVQDASETKLPLTGSQFAIIGIGAVMAAVAAKKLRDQKKAAASAADEDAE